MELLAGHRDNVKQNPAPESPPIAAARSHDPLFHLALAERRCGSWGNARK
jgi:hypothetical protein